MKALRAIAGRIGPSARDFATIRQRARTLLAEAEWERAGVAFERLLVANPNDFRSRMGLGACWFGAGELQQAEACFRLAIELRPDDASAYLELSRTLDADGRPLGALWRLHRALTLDPALRCDAKQRALLAWAKDEGARPLAGQRSKRTLFIDISDLLKYLRVNTGISGIQRVQVCVIASVLRAYADQRIVFGYCGRAAGDLHVIDEERIFDLIDEVNHRDISRRKLDVLLHAARNSSQQMQLERGDVFLILGAFWIFTTYATTIERLQTNGVRAGVFIHDLIPLTHPQFVALALRRSYRAQFNKLMERVDFACTSSEFVADELRRTLATDLKRMIPVAAAPLAQESNMQKSVSSQAAKVDADFMRSLPREFVLCVSTLEARKNHLLLVDIWEKLYKKHGKQMPSLVLVGKWGWKFAPLRQRLQDTGHVAGKVVVLGSLSEARLHHLYRNCLFTVFPSFVEGWGLPVSESLAFGKPCITSKTSSMPEVGGALARYIDPHNADGAAAVIEQTMTDRAGLAEWTARVQREFRPRTWTTVTADLLDGVVAGATRAPSRTTTTGAR